MPRELHKPEGNLYDKIIKENAERLFLPLIEDHLKVKIKRFQPFQEKMQTTIEREMDFFYEVETIEGQTLLLHLEFQTENDKEMIYRAAEYHGMALRRKRLPIRHIVVFLGAGTMTMDTQLKESEVFTGFEVINIHQMNTTDLLASQIPEVIILAILSDYSTDEREAVLRLVLQQLKQVCKNANELSRYTKQLIVLSRLRKFDETAVKIIKDMSITYDVETDYLFLQGQEKGMKIGEEKGMKIGEEKAKLKAQKKQILSIIKMLQKQVQPDLIADFLALEESYVLAIQKELLQEKKIVARLKRKQKITTISKVLKVSELVVEALKELLEKEK